MSKKKTEAPILADEALGKSEEFVLKHKNLITGVVFAVILFIAAYLGYQNFIQEPKEVEANKALVVAVQNYEDGNYAESLEGDGVNYGTIAVSEEYSGTDAGNLANLYAGLALAKQEKYEEAIEYLEAYDGNDAIIAPKAKHALANCYAYTGNNKKAISLLLEAAKEATTRLLLHTAGETLLQCTSRRARQLRLSSSTRRLRPSTQLVYLFRHARLTDS